MKTYYPKISISIVVFNAVETLENSIKSIIDQSYRNWELIIIDGGSNDGTINILNKYKDLICFWISEPDLGIYDAMNKSIKYLSGDYVYFMGSDDVFFNELALEKFVNAINRSTFSLNYIYYGNVLFKHKKIIYDGYFYNLKFCLRNICHQSILYPLSIFKKYKYNIDYKFLADYVLNLKVKSTDEYTFYYIPVTLTIYNDQGSSGSSRDRLFLKNRLDFIKKAFPMWIYFYAYMRFMIKNLING